MNTINRSPPGFPFKQFVKESKDSQEKTVIPRLRSTVNKDGNEIKEFYEDLVRSGNSSKKHSVSKKAVTPTNESECYKKKVATYTREQLFQAAGGDDVCLISEALNNGESGRHVLTRQTDHFGWSALMMASVSGSEAIVQLLLQSGADTSVRDRAGNTALTLARQKGHSKIVDLISRDDFKFTDSIACVFDEIFENENQKCLIDATK